MPKEKTESIRGIKMIVEELRSRNEDYREFHDKALAVEKREAKVARSKAKIGLAYAIAAFAFWTWLRWTIPRLFGGHFMSFLLWTLFYAVCMTGAMAYGRAIRETLQIAVLGAALKAKLDLDDLREAEAASQEAAQGVGPQFKVSKEVSKAYLEKLRKRHAGIPFWMDFGKKVLEK